MATHGPHPHLARFVRGSERAGDHFAAFSARHWAALLVVALLAVAATILMLRPGLIEGERNALLRMAPEERRALYTQTRRNAEMLCEHARQEEALADRCAAAARFLAAFPECDEECRTFANAHYPGPTR